MPLLAEAPSRRLASAWMAAAVVLAGSTAAAVPGRLVPGERVVFDAVNGLPGPAPVVVAVKAVMLIGTLPAALSVIAVVVAVTRRWRPGLAVLAAYVPVRVATDVMKAVVGRHRPRFLFDVEHLRATAQGEGFPSGHTANSVVLALTLGLLFPRLRWPLLAVAAVVASARVYVGVHLPLDLVGGVALGVLGSAIGWAVGLSPVTSTAARDRYVPDR